MSDPRERLTALLKDRENWHPHDLRDAVDAILAEFLLVPRDSIVGTEYGWRDDDVVFSSRGNTEKRVLFMAANFDVVAVERPVLPWSPIPLPEDGIE